MSVSSLRNVFLAALVALSGCKDGGSPNPTTPDPTTPAPVVTPVQWASVSAGETHTCGLSRLGVAYCWGRGANGQAGTGLRDSSAYAVRVTGGVPFAQVAAGITGTCARTAAGEVYCWGDDNTTAPQLRFGLDRLHVATIKAPEQYAYGCGIQPDGGVACWNATSVAYQAGPYRDTAPGADCLLDAAGHVLCSQHRLVGDYHPFAVMRVNPTVGDSNAVFTSITGGSQSACALRSDGVPFCTTSFSFGATLSAWVERLEPVPGSHVFTQISAAGLRACGLDAAGGAWCWDLTSVTSPHIGAEYRMTDPVKVAGLPALAQISAGSTHTCGVTADGDAYCWGSNRFGEVGTGTFGGTAVAPTKVPGAIS